MNGHLNQEMGEASVRHLNERTKWLVNTPAVFWSLESVISPIIPPSPPAPHHNASGACENLPSGYMITDNMIIWHDNLKEMPSLISSGHVMMCYRSASFTVQLTTCIMCVMMPSPFIHLVIISLPVLQIYGQKTNPFTLPINLASLRYHAKKWLSEHSPYLHKIGNKIRIKPPNQAFPCAPVGLPSNPVNSPIEWCLNLDRLVDEFQITWIKH